MKQMITTLLIAVLTLPSLAEQSKNTPTDATAAVKSIKQWQTDVDGVHFSLTQLLPEQIHAFYLNRGSSLAQIDDYANSCVYMTILRNDNAAGTIHFISHDWSVLLAGQAHSLRSVEQWLQTLNAAQSKKSALIAFRWAQFPPEQEYEPGGDWNQGMLSMNLSAGSQFDIIAHWDVAGKPHQAILTGVQCVK